MLILLFYFIIGLLLVGIFAHTMDQAGILKYPMMGTSIIAGLVIMLLCWPLVVAYLSVVCWIELCSKAITARRIKKLAADPRYKKTGCPECGEESICYNKKQTVARCVSTGETKILDSREYYKCNACGCEWERKENDNGKNS